jgi:asparagine synthase (glutamine-hydrolysing)
MPGIVGIVSHKPGEACESLVKAMLASMRHEAFYVSGMYSASEMGIYAGWVACENSFAASQVFFNEQKNIALIFAGECFADPETRTGLERKGHVLGRNRGDWLVHLYEEEGDQFFEKLNGLFSGLLIDKRRGRAFLFNDRYGIERIYWHESKDALYFASEAKALLRILPELREFDENGVAQFVTYGCTLGSRTLFRGIHLLPGGSLWSFENGSCHKTRYFSPGTWESQPTLSAASFEETFQETFKRILPHYFESQSRIGISLTGGLDSRMIMACRPDTSEDPVCYTFAGEKGETLDVRLAARVAEACGLEHQTLRIGPDFFADFRSHADRTVYVTDGCLTICGAHEIYMNKRARRLSPVRMTGNFGNEVLRGTSTFKPFGLAPSAFNPEFRQLCNSWVPLAANGNEHHVTFAAFQEIPLMLFGSLAASRSQIDFRTPYLDNQIVALAYQTPKSLRTSPLPGLHLVKDNDRRLSSIPTDMGQMGQSRGIGAALRRFLSAATFKLDHFSNEGLPHWLSPLDPLFRHLNSGIGILGLHKHLHYRSWFRRELAGYLNDAFNDARIRQNPFWNSDFLERVAREHIHGRKNYMMEIDAVLTLEAVERLLFRNLPCDASLAPKVERRLPEETFSNT